MTAAVVKINAKQSSIKCCDHQTKQSKLDIYMRGAFQGKVIDFTDESVVQYDVQAVRNTSLDNDDNNDRK